MTERSFQRTGISVFDESIQGFPKGSLTEIAGATSSGRTSLMMSTLAEATTAGETCALVDATGGFDPCGAANHGVHLDRLLWVRCRSDAGNALRCADLIVQAGGFGLVCLDLAGLEARQLNRIPISYWHRFRLALESTETAMVVLSGPHLVKSFAACSIECRQEGVHWSGLRGATLLRGLQVSAEPRKSMQTPARYCISAV